MRAIKLAANNHQRVSDDLWHGDQDTGYSDLAYKGRSGASSEGQAKHP
jgi:hypothetical protein